MTATASAWTVEIEKFDPADPRLGRHLRHDSRSLAFQVVAKAIDDLVSKHHRSYIGTLDQGNVGSCTGNAATKCLSYPPFYPPLALAMPGLVLDEAYALGVYSDETKIDPFEGVYLPDDTGSDGLTAAKVLKARKLITGYQHATSLAATLTALTTRPVITGTKWRSGMYDPAPDGRMNISGTDEGGHEYVLDEIDVVNRRVWMQNSWSDSWGIDGRAWFTFDDFGALLHDGGDVTVFTPLTEPAPTPLPVAPTSPDDRFEVQVRAWLSRKPMFYKSFQTQAQTWLTKRGTK